MSAEPAGKKPTSAARASTLVPPYRAVLERLAKEVQLILWNSSNPSGEHVQKATHAMESLCLVVEQSNLSSAERTQTILELRDLFQELEEDHWTKAFTIRGVIERLQSRCGHNWICDGCTPGQVNNHQCVSVVCKCALCVSNEK